MVAHEQLLKRGHTQSCGCLQEERTAKANTRHGHTSVKRSKVYRVWEAMVWRCNNPNATYYEDYGGRGIKVCDRWLSFENFFADMGEPPAGHQIDRIDNDGHYEPCNCRWATAREQARNKRSNRMVTFQGQVMCLTDAIQTSGISSHTVKSRLQRGWSIERALSA